MQAENEENSSDEEEVKAESMADQGDAVETLQASNNLEKTES